MTRRRSPIYPTTIVGSAPDGRLLHGQAIERIFLPLMRMQLPEVRDIAMPPRVYFTTSSWFPSGSDTQVTRGK
jgi:4-hydroxy-3-polyprenylbenzoate decarboxylase